MAGKAQPIAKGTFSFEHEGKAHELDLELLSDEKFRVIEQTEKAKPAPAPGAPPPKVKDFKFFKPGPQGARMPSGLWNSSVPLPGHDIHYSEGDVKRK